MIITISAIIVVIAGAVGLCIHKSNCKSEICNKSTTSVDSTAKDACGSCGKNSCDKNCASSQGSDSSNLKGMMPSCNLSNSEMEGRKKFLLETMAKKIVRTEELETGYDMIFQEPIEYSKELLEFINFERGCCSGFSFALIFEPDNKATHLQMYGSKEIKEELKSGLKEVGFLK